MGTLSIDNVISLILVFVSWLLILFLLTAKTKNRLSNVLLILFLMVNAQDSSGLFASYFIYPKFPGLGMAINSTLFLKFPLLYLYFQSVIYSDFKLRKIHLLHLIPLIINNLVLTPRFYAVGFDMKWAFLNAAEFRENMEIRFSYIFVHIQLVVYVIMCFILIKKYKTLLLENYSNASLFNYNWMFQLTAILAFESFVATLKNVFLFSDVSSSAYFYSQRITGFFGLGFICWIVLKAMHSPELFRGIASNLQLVKNLVLKGIHHEMTLKTISHDKNDDELAEIIKLKKFMFENEPYLDASLTLYDLSKKMNIPVKDLSILINHSLNQHFFDFVNGYRIRRAMEILQDQDKNDLTVLEILYDVGFNSKSSFNTAFKKYTHLTPTEYRRKFYKSAV